MRTLIWILACCALAAGLSADVTVPDGKAAVAEMVIGQVSLTALDGSSTDLAKGQSLSYGDRIVTGSDGRVLLRLASRAGARVAPNSEMTFQDPGQRKGTFLNLVKGWARFLVGNRQPGEAFEVSTDNAVAAVKGTDMEVGLQDDGSTYACVFHSDHHPALNLGDPKSGQGVDLDQGEGGIYDGKLFTKINDLEKTIQKDEQRYKSLPTPPADLTGAQGPPTPPNPELLGALKGLMQESINKVVADTQRDIKIDNIQNQQGLTDDRVANRMGVDASGTPVQITSYVVRPAANVVDLITVDTRNTGPLTGATTASELTTWNKALPQDWMSVAKTPLNDPSNLDSDGYALFYKQNQVFSAANPEGDSLNVSTVFDAPFFLGGVGYNVDSTHYALAQTWTQFMYLNALTAVDVGLPTGIRTAASVAPQSSYTTYEITAYQLVDPNLVAGSAKSGAQYMYDPNYLNASALAPNLTVNSADPLNFTFVNPLWSGAVDGGNPNMADYIYQDNYVGYSITESVQLLDGLGVSQALPTLAGNNLANAFNGGNPAPADFKGQDPSLNLEVIFQGTTGLNGSGSLLLGEPIDLLFPAQVFDSMDMIVFPSYGQGG